MPLFGSLVSKAGTAARLASSKVPKQSGIPYALLNYLGKEHNVSEALGYGNTRGQAGTPGTQAQTATQDPGFTGGGGSARGAAGGGGAAGVSAAQLAGARNNVFGDQNTINSLYQAVDGQLTAYGNEQRGRLDSAYNTGLDTAGKTYAGANNTVNQNFTGRNLYDSSLRGNALGDNNTAYQGDVKNINDTHEQGLGQLGQTLGSVKSQIDASHPQYDLSQYSDLGSLEGLHQQLTSHIQNLRDTQSKYLTNGQLKGQLDSITGAKSGLADQLKGKLDALMAGNADSAAKQGIANTYIASAPADQQDPLKQYLAQALATSR